MLGVLIATVVFALIVIGLIINFKKIVRWIKNMALCQIGLMKQF